MATTTTQAMKTTDLFHPPGRTPGGRTPPTPATAIPRGAPTKPGGAPEHDLLVLSPRPDLSPEYFGRIIPLRLVVRG